LDFRELDSIIRRAGAERVAGLLAPYITEARLSRIESVLSARLDSLHVAAERPEDPRNAAAIVRSAEALGALHVHTIQAPPEALHAPKQTQGSFNWVHTHHHQQYDTFFAAIRASGARLAGALMEGDCAVDDLPVDRPLCIIFGNEKVGLSEAMLSACDLTFRIPMVGMSESLNMSVSAAIALYSAARARRKVLGAPGDLSGDRLHEERARYYARSVERRLLLALVDG
jgi:tRNA (guanosine-2'-O-)-methyltransferase